VYCKGLAKLVLLIYQANIEDGYIELWPVFASWDETSAVGRNLARVHDVKRLYMCSRHVIQLWLLE